MDPNKPAPTVSRTGLEPKIVAAANALVLGIARHWLLLFNSVWAVYVLLPFAAPILMHLGWTTPARLIYAAYSFMCHQLPDHSYFLYGDQLTPTLTTLEAGGMTPGQGMLEQRQFHGNELLGYKVAICQRDVAIYMAVLLAGLLFGLVRQRLPTLKLRWYLLLLIPIGLDGGTQLVGLRESDWLLRTLTGALFGIASVWLAYPYIDDAMQDVLTSEVGRRPLTPV
jgi:uncharacterized membrane protein